MSYTFKDSLLDEKRFVCMSLSQIYGVGFSRAKYICDLIGLSSNRRLKSFNAYYYFILVFLLKHYYGTDVLLKRFRFNLLRHFVMFKSYKAVKYFAGLPIRGQQTHNNAKTFKRVRIWGRSI